MPALMRRFGCTRHRPSIGRTSRLVSSLQIACVLLSIAAGPALARGAEDTGNAAAASADLVDQAMRLGAAGNRVEELDRDAWKAIANGGDFEGAATLMSQAADLARTEFGERHWFTTLKQTLAAGLQSVAGLAQEKRDLFVEAVKGQSRSTFLRSKGEGERATLELQKSHDKCVRALGADHILSIYFSLGLIDCELRLHDYPSAKAHAEAAVRALKKAWGEKNPGYAHAIYFQGLAEYGLRDMEPARRHFREALEILEPVVRDGANDFYIGMYAGAQLNQARLLNDLEEFAAAEPVARRASALLALQNQYSQFMLSQLEVARSASGQGHASEAETILNFLVRASRSDAPREWSVALLSRYAEHLRRVHRDADAERLESRIREMPLQASNLKAGGDARPSGR